MTTYLQALFDAEKNQGSDRGFVKVKYGSKKVGWVVLGLPECHGVIRGMYNSAVYVRDSTHRITDNILRKIWAELKEKRKEELGNFIVTGNPGIGKSRMAFWIIRQALKSDHISTIIFDYRENRKVRVLYVLQAFNNVCSFIAYQKMKMGVSLWTRVMEEKMAFARKCKTRIICTLWTQ